MGNKPTKDELIEAISRSGYLLESKIIIQLMKLELVVESNLAYLDTITQKSREIDVVASFHPNSEILSEYYLSSQIKLIIEIKNNTLPLVLMSKLPNSPDIPIWNGVKEYITYPSPYDKFKEVKYELFELEEEFHSRNLYTQYCSFQPKKGSNELMAFHPNNLYESINKICFYTDSIIEDLNSRTKEKDLFYRNFKYIPTLLIKEDLYELEVDEEGINPILQEVEESKLLFNYHFKGEPKNAVIQVITIKGLDKFIEKMRRTKEKIQSLMIENLKENKKIT